ncbi:MAG: hypothetical protein QE271_08280 [Bacteriovoracaceae bacterium]|nr:hypothetical protein [Bacteriovoracaceae bacterium]
MKNLIDKLVVEHRPQKWWERPFAFKALLLSSTLAMIFLNLLLVKKIYFFNSSLYLVFLLMGTLISWLAFTSLLNPIRSSQTFWTSILGSLMIGVILNLVLENFISQTIAHQRNLSLRIEDWSCFWHTVLIGSLPIILLFATFRNFFIPNPRKTIVLFSLSTVFSALVVTEISCPNREWWHLLFGHQTSILGIMFVANLIFYIRKFQQSGILKVG